MGLDAYLHKGKRMTIHDAPEGVRRLRSSTAPSIMMDVYACDDPDPLGPGPSRHNAGGRETTRGYKQQTVYVNQNGYQRTFA